MICSKKKICDETDSGIKELEQENFDFGELERLHNLLIGNNGSETQNEFESNFVLL